MTAAGQLIVDVLRQAWTALAGAIAAFAVLAILSQVLKTASAGAMGARYWVWESVAGAASIMLLALYAFLGVPALTRAALAALPAGAGCGPITELSAFAIMLLGGLAALRMLRSVAVAVFSASVGGEASFSKALLESGEVILGMAIAGVAVPLAAQFLGACA